MSCYANEVVARDGLDRQGGQFLTKPFTADVLTEAVRGLVERNLGRSGTPARIREKLSSSS
jgi:DNA-binding response OmpR family regulator